MHFKDHAPRLKFLKDSASSLSSDSPSTAAFLMMVHNGIFLEESKPLSQRQHEACCGACGYTRNLELTRPILRKGSNKRRTNATKFVSEDGVMVFKCGQCRRRTVTPARKEIIRSHAISKGSFTTTTVMPMDNSEASSCSTGTSKDVPGSTDVTRVSKAADNASSKKRAKARKQGGLQALLASKQSQTKATPALDLFDFLQQ